MPAKFCSGSFSGTAISVATFLCVFLSSPSSVALRPVILQQGHNEYPIGLHLEYLEDKEKKWTIEEVSSNAFAKKFTKSDSRTPNFGYTTSAYWFRFEWQSRLKHKQQWLLEVACPLLDRIELYIERPDGTFARKVAGISFPFDQREFKHRHFVFPIEVRAGGSQRIYLRVRETGSLVLPLTLWSQQGFLEKERQSQLGWGIFYGLMLVMSVYNLFLFLSVRDRSYLYYAFFICGILFMALFDNGSGYEYLCPNWPWLANRGTDIGSDICILVGLLFLKEFLNLRQNSPAWNRALSILAILTVGLLLRVLLVPPQLYVYYLTDLILVTPLALIIFFAALAVLIILSYRGFKPARLALLALACVVCGGILFILYQAGVAPVNFFTANGVWIGGALCAVLFSFALADRINLMRQEKEQAQDRALAVQKQAAENLGQEVERKTLALQKAYDSLAEHDRLKSRFFANVSHELRTPLTLILTPLEQLLAGTDALKEAVKKKLRSMAGNTQRLLRLVNQLLDFSRLESGGTTASFELREIHAVVEPVLQGFEPFARSKDLKLELRGPEELPEVYVDPAKLDKVLCNLLSNACKFTRAGGTVVVRLASDGRSLTISVKDTGIGISEEDLPMIFERFHQVDGTASRVYEGTGIGLALSKELVEVTGGKLEVESELGVGTTFTVTLPLGKEHIKNPSLIRSESSEDPAATGARAAAAALTAELGTARSLTGAAATTAATTAEETEGKPDVGTDSRALVLVVEDNADMRALVTEICRNDFRVLEATDGRQGLEIVQEHRPALVISDVMMPAMDGHELLRRVRANRDTASIPVMLLTAKAGSEMKLEGLESGADDYLTKPFQSRELLARARNLVRLQQQEQQLRGLNTKLQREVVSQAADLERARMLGRFLPPEVVRSVLEEGQPVQVGQERCRLTVFRLELRGFEAVEALAPEDMTAMLNGYLSAMTEVAFRHGATLDRFSRDAVTGFFGAPHSAGAETDAERCVELARALWQRAREIRAGWKGLLEESAPAPTLVIASGHATVGNFGSSQRLEYTAVGGPVTEAAALLAMLPAGEVACTNATWELVKDKLEAPLGTITTDFYGRTVRLHRLLSMPEAVSAGPVATISSGPRDTTAQIEGKLCEGSFLAERYKITQRLGEGGMAVVYRAHDTWLDTAVAVKLLRPNDSSATRAPSLRREVKLARLINHPNVARIFDVAEWEGHEFIVMELIEGISLDARLKEGGPLPLAEGHRILTQLSAGLAAAHAARVVHRDLKPSNVMLGRDDRIAILDFGIAKWLAEQQGGGETLQGFGTPYYMAPEQITGGPIDERTDIYALGVVAFEMFTGRRLFDSVAPTAIANRHLRELPVDPLLLRSDLPPRLSAVILRCLEKDPAQRFWSVAELSPLLAGLVGAHGAESQLEERA